MIEERIKQLQTIAYDKLKLKEYEFCYIGGLSLEYYGIRNANDIDLCLTQDAYRRVEKLGIIKGVKTSFYGVMRCDAGDNVEITLNNYNIMGISDAEIIENKEYHIKTNNLKFIRPEFVYTTKLLAKKSNNNAQRDITSIVNYFRDSKDNFDYNLVKSLYKTAKHEILKKRIKYAKNYILKYLKKPDIEKHYNAIIKSQFIYNVYPTEKFLTRQMDKYRHFQAYDVIVRYGFAKEFLEKGLNKESYWAKLYSKMQTKRGNGAKDHTFSRYIPLIESFKDGYDYDSYITIAKNGYLIDDGSHRVALCLLFNVPYVSLKEAKKHFDTRNYGIKWFENNNFSNEEIKSIVQLKEQIFMEKGIYFPVILWGSVTQYVNTICNENIKKYGEIISTKKFTIDDDSKFRKTVFDIYSSDDIARWKVEKKLEYLKPYPKEFTVVYVEIHEPKFRKKTMNNHDISTVVEKMKKEIRDIYKGKIDNYFYDIVVHMCDNYAQNRIVNSVLKEVKNG